MIPLVLTLAAQLSSLSLTSGDMPSICAQIAKASGKPAVILLEEAQRDVKAYSIKYLDEKNLINRLGRYLEMEAQGKQRFAFANPAWPETIFGRRSSLESLSYRAELTGKWPLKPNADQTVTIESKEPLALLPVLSGPWPKPIVVAPFYQYFRVAVSAKDQPPEEVFKTLAAAIGARTKFGEKQWALEFDGREFRRRLIARLQNRLASPPKSGFAPLYIADTNYTIASLDVVSDQQLEDAASKSNWEIEVEVAPGSSLFGATLSRIKTYSQAKEPWSLSAKFANMLDLGQPIQATLNLYSGQAHIQGKIKDDPKGGVSF